MCFLIRKEQQNITFLRLLIEKILNVKPIDVFSPNWWLVIINV